MNRTFALRTIAVGVCLFMAWGCAPATEEPGDSAAVSEPESTELPILDERDTWPRIEAPEDLARVTQLRDGWISAFAAGDAEALDFVFARDAVMTDLSVLVGEDAASPDRFFEQYTAEFKLTNDLPIEYGNWGSYYADYELTLTPKNGGPGIEDSGSFMARIWRDAENGYEVVRGPSVGEPGPEFALNRMDGSGEVHLADLRDKPTVLVFGSFT